MASNVRSFSLPGQSRKLTLTLGVALLALVLGLAAAGSAAAAKPAIFKAGAAASNINPDTPQYPGGYDYKSGPFVEVNDPLEVRAFVAGQGKQAAVLISTDSTGWFSAYASDVFEPYGIDRTREKIADALNARGYNITRDNVIINSTHAHSTPVLVGIWGTVDWEYLRKVSDGAVSAAIEAAERAKPSEIWAGVGSVRSLVWQNGQGTNHPDGFEVDEQLPVLWARDAKTGATNALYANIPNHPDQYRASAHQKFSADVPGWVRARLDEKLGGTSVIASGTLGRQEPPGDVNDYTEVIPQGEYDANQILRTLGQATPITEGGIDAAEQRFTTEADNDELLLLINGFTIPPGACIDAEGYCTIPRSKAPEYYSPAGGGNPTTVTATTHAIRIGDVLVTSNPGEAFAEVNRAIRESIDGPRQIHVAGMTDMLGYYYDRDDYGPIKGNIIGSSNFPTYNVGPNLAQDNADASRQAAAELGYATTPKTVSAQYDPSVAGKPGVQWYPERIETADPVISLYGSSAKSQIQKIGPAYNNSPLDPLAIPAPATIDWDFGDDTTATTNDEERFDHTFPGPGTYEVTATVEGTNSLSETFTRSWTDTITINEPLEVNIVTAAKLGSPQLHGLVAEGGSGKLVAGQWTCPNGKQGRGLSIECPITKQGGQLKATAVDSAGNTASVTTRVPKGPSLKMVKVQPKLLKLKTRARAKVVRVVLRNPGGMPAAGVKVCVNGNARVKPVKRCVKTGRIKAGKKKTLKLKLKGRKKGKANLKLKVTSVNAGKANGRIKVRVR